MRWMSRSPGPGSSTPCQVRACADRPAGGTPARRKRNAAAPRSPPPPTAHPRRVPKVRSGPIAVPLESRPLAEPPQALGVDAREFREELRDGDVAEILDQRAHDLAG